jgi:hypothetical protein
MSLWKSVLLRSVGFGVGFAVTLCVATGAWFWYSGRPKPLQPPIPWNASAITAEYDYVTTKGDKNYLEFNYVLQNNTDFDYRLESMVGNDLSVQLKRSRSFAQFGGLKDALEFPIFVPAKSRTRVSITIPYAYTGKQKGNLTREDLDRYDTDVAKFATEQFSNLDGFVMFDNSIRYKIEFPAGWSQPKKKAPVN